ncbi:hypothetical protein [Ligilactobacillus salivarius]|uniref:hypothetical protein n=1 Tax=Ligilactobacillus salivarius TaxID=1624 RepID=UPI0018A00A03|nr:hypothetical protein [Ligilactobacillus salivarius]MDH4959822.1 hypothetical protein [Ligilactobacillus salivarius]UUY24031.1 hypothetical protein NUU06_03580 [Ligilactobacillus salivarius]
MDNNVLYPQVNQSLIIASKQLATITKSINKTYTDPLNNLNRLIKQMYDFRSLYEISKIQLNVNEILNLPFKKYTKYLQKNSKFQINIPTIDISNFSNYYKSDFRIPVMLEDVINKSLQNPDKVNDLLSKNIDKTLYNKNINSSDFIKEPRIKNTDNTKTVINYNIDTVNITYQTPTSKESNNRFDESPDSNRDKSPSNKPTDHLKFFTFLFSLFNNIAQLPGAVEGSKMIFNVLKNILDYLQ